MSERYDSATVSDDPVFSVLSYDMSLGPEGLDGQRAGSCSYKGFGPVLRVARWEDVRAAILALVSKDVAASGACPHFELTGTDFDLAVNVDGGYVGSLKFVIKPIVYGTEEETKTWVSIEEAQKAWASGDRCGRELPKAHAVMVDPVKEIRVEYGPLCGGLGGKEAGPVCGKLAEALSTLEAQDNPKGPAFTVGAVESGEPVETDESDAEVFRPYFTPSGVAELKAAAAKVALMPRVTPPARDPGHVPSSMAQRSIDKARKPSEIPAWLRAAWVLVAVLSFGALVFMAVSALEGRLPK